jgi:UDP-N-acetylmuramate dehydrogenase
MTTLKLGGQAIAEVVVEHEQDLDALSEALRALGGESLVLGEGSNILAADHDLSIVLVRMAMFDQPRQQPDNDSSAVLVQVWAGMRLPRFLGWLRTRGLSGLEELTGVPGSLGGAVAMNAGAYGRDLGQLLKRILVWTPAEGVLWREFGQWRADYRSFDPGVLGRPVLILAAELRLRRDAPEAIHARMRQYYTQKKSTQPVTMASAGCVFKNPSPDQPAGRLLEQAGLRGMRLGKMAFSGQHANFLVNLGGGRSEDAFALLELARQRVCDLFGLRLETEVKVVT